MSYTDYLSYLDKLKNPNSDIYNINLYNFYIDDRRSLLIYDDNLHLKYCRLNLNFERLNSGPEMAEYKIDSKSYKSIFKNFLELNMGAETEYINNPYYVLPQFEQYFDQIKPEQIDYLNYFGMKITINSIMYVKVPGYVRIHDWVVSDKNTFLKYTKYNFYFDLYSSQMKIYGSKLLIFSDFLSRNYVAPIPIVFDLYENFVKYFFNMTDDLQKYICTKGLNSSYEFDKKSYKYLSTSIIVSHLTKIKSNFC
jgi:hypothetical protein